MITATPPDVTTARADASASVHRDFSNPPPAAADRQRWRAERFERRRISSKLVISADRDAVGATDDQWIRPRRVARCSWRLGVNVGVHLGTSGAHFSGTERCGSVWGCPVCSAVIRADRAAEIQAGVVPHLDAGGGALFVTGTIRHDLGDLLATGLNAVIEGWTCVIRGNPWKKWAQKIGLVGYIRSTEITRGYENGWHPHIHGLLLLEAPISDTLASAFTAWVSERWRKMVTKLGAREPSDEYGFKVRAVGRDGRVLASYLSKIQEKPGGKLGAELARGDLKSGRAGGSRMPFELLDTAFDRDDDAALWLDYLDATAGRQAIVFSKGLRVLLGLTEKRTDEQIIAESENGELVGLLDGETYDELRKARQLHVLLDQLETGSGDLLGLLSDPPKLAPEDTDLPESGEVFPPLRAALIGSKNPLDARASRNVDDEPISDAVVSITSFSPFMSAAAHRAAAWSRTVPNRQSRSLDS